MTHLRLVALDATLLVLGGSVVHALGLAPTRRRLLELAGLAYLTGWMLAVIAMSLLLVAGSSLALAQVLPALALLAAAAFLAGRRRARAETEPPVELGRPPLAIVPVLLLAAYLGVLLLRTVRSGVSWWDAWAFWVPKAMSIYYFDGLDTGPGGVTSYANPDYPPGLPALHALVFRFVGDADPLVLLVQDWVLATAFLVAVAGLLLRRVPPLVLGGASLLIALTPNFGRQIGALTGDLPLAFGFALAGLLVGLWLLERRPGHLVLALVFVTGGALVKKEGLFLAALLAAAVVVAARRDRAVRRAAVLLVAAPLLTSLVWRLWLRTHDVTYISDYALGSLLDPGFLAGRLDRLGVVLRELPEYFLDPTLWLLALPLAVTAAVLALPSSPVVARVVLTLVPASFVGAAVVYWISRPDVQWHLATSAERVPGAVVFLCLALLPLLFADGLARREGAA